MLFQADHEFYYMWRGRTTSWHESLKFHIYLVISHALPTSDVVTVSKSQRPTGDNVVFTWRQCFKRTVTSCKCHTTDMFSTNGGVPTDIFPNARGVVVSGGQFIIHNPPPRQVLLRPDDRRLLVSAQDKILQRLNCLIFAVVLF